MWILFRLGLFIAFILSKTLFQRKGVGQSARCPGGLECWVSEKKNKQGAVTQTTVSFAVDSSCAFRLARESRLLGFFKKIGFGSELQVGDQAFDEHFYIASDSSRFLRQLQSSGELRRTLLSLSQNGGRDIRLVGGRLSIVFDGSFRLTAEVEEAFRAIQSALASREFQRSGVDRYLWRVLAIEAILWGGVGYLVGVHLEFTIDRSMSVLDGSKVFWMGFKLGGLLLAAWFTLIYLALRESSRAPLLLAETFIFSTVGILISGFPMVADGNRIFDRSEVTVTEAVVRGKESETSGSRRNRRTDYYFILDASPGFGIPRRLRVGSFEYLRFTPPQRAEIRLRDGAFGIRYIHSIEAGERVSESPIASTVKRLDAKKSEQAKQAIAWRSEPPAPIVGEVSLAETHWPNRRLRSQEPMVDGLNHGIARYWHDNGQLYAEIPWHRGQKNGRFQLYRADGTIEGDYSLKDGQPHGLMRWYDDKGQLTVEALYINGVHQPLTHQELERLK